MATELGTLEIEKYSSIPKLYGLWPKLIRHEMENTQRSARSSLQHEQQSKLSEYDKTQNNSHYKPLNNIFLKVKQFFVKQPQNECDKSKFWRSWIDKSDESQQLELGSQLNRAKSIIIDTL